MFWSSKISYPATFDKKPLPTMPSTRPWWKMPFNPSANPQCPAGFITNCRPSTGIANSDILSAGRQSNRPAGTSVLLQRLNRVLDSRPLNGDFYKTVGIKRLLGLHDLNPAFNGLLDVLNRLFVGLSLR